MQIVQQITNHVNSYSRKQIEFNEAMSREHRTLQQSFTKLCLQWLEYCASDDYRTDGRNEQSKQVSKKLIDAWKAKHNFNPSEYLSLI